MKNRILLYRFLERLWGICGNFYSLLFITLRTSRSDGISLVLVCHVVYTVVYIWDALQRLMMLKDWLLSGAATLESCGNFKCWSLFGRMSHWMCLLWLPWTLSPSISVPVSFLFSALSFPGHHPENTLPASWFESSLYFDPNDYALKPLKLWATISGYSFGIVLAGILLLGWKSD